MKIFYSSYDQPNQTFLISTPKYILLLLFQNDSFLVLVPTRISFTNPTPLPSNASSLFQTILPPSPSLPCTLKLCLSNYSLLSLPPFLLSNNQPFAINIDQNDYYDVSRNKYNSTIYHLPASTRLLLHIIL